MKELRYIFYGFGNVLSAVIFTFGCVAIAAIPFQESPIAAVAIVVG
jgi:hypothetical protein